MTPKHVKGRTETTFLSSGNSDLSPSYEVVKKLTKGSEDSVEDKWAKEMISSHGWLEQPLSAASKTASEAAHCTAFGTGGHRPWPWTNWESMCLHTCVHVYMCIPMCMWVGMYVLNFL